MQADSWNQILEEVDQNHDGVITFEEFKSGIQDVVVKDHRKQRARSQTSPRKKKLTDF